MKNSKMSLLVLIAISSFASNYAMASGQDHFYCRANCVVVDQSESTIYNLGSIKGLSQVSEVEAFDDMNQSCKNLAAAKGYDPEDTSVIKGVVKVSQKQVTSEGSQVINQSTYSGWFFNRNRSKFNSQEEHRSNENKFSYEINYADDGSCAPLVVNPEGKPKYIGSEQPLG